MLYADKSLLCYVSNDFSIDDQGSTTVMPNMNTKNLHSLRIASVIEKKAKYKDARLISGPVACCVSNRIILLPG